LPETPRTTLDSGSIVRRNLGSCATWSQSARLWGPRWGEAAALRRRRIDFLRSRVEVAESLADVDGHLHFGPTKGYARRWVKLPRWVTEMLLPRDLGPDELAFTAPKGGPLHYSNFRKRVWLRAVGGEIPEDLTPHHLRHTCASLLIAREPP
jgi:integrase